MGTQGTHAMQVKALTVENGTLQSQVAKQRSMQASEMKILESIQRELNDRLEDLADEKKLLQEQLSKATLAASDPDTSMVRYQNTDHFQMKQLLPVMLS